jgi:quercetin dioxygenase-like cupin family protein
MQNQAFVLTPESYPKALSVVGVDVTVLAAADVTGGYEVTMQKGNAGSGPPLHSHPWDECFFVLSGEVEFSIEQRQIKAKPGTMFHLPAGTPHGFTIKQNGTTMLEFTGQGSQSTQMFTSVNNEVAHGVPSAADVPKLIDILARYGAAVEA